MTRLLLLLLGCVAAVSCYSHPYEVCNGLDDDDDPTTADGLEDPLVGTSCDGPDADRCGEGVLACIDGAIACNDATTDNVETCNTDDDDCDGVIDEMFDVQTDPTNCGACGKVCENPNGGVACAAGTCEPTCANGAVDCDLDPDNGCEVFRDRNPRCDELSGVESLAGDAGMETASFQGTDEAIIEVTLREVSTLDASVRGRFTLDVPPGLDFDLYLYCDACSGAIVGSSREPAGRTEVVDVIAFDRANVNDDHTVYAEVRFVEETTCGDRWTLTVTGNTGTQTRSVCP